MDMHMHHTIEFTGAATWILIAALIIIACCLLYPMMSQLMLPPAKPHNRIGYR